ncbi:ChuX/HutX family heme-like substrate-binding protein [Roseimicrobium sp. ORNL1]|uniref:ChuX/HutX family heme-like substrate-binding protein n=1 Tax=Roseimicrobium sp. ORNL1 TaxID=2711231 RepID=UPI0013E15765|nr:ChuX/HutX family heme-like substrate-binding protein [Roseimicrobium sp. ORNL1]QIF00666.1 hypothetical protein G5S37_03725 [Roseimicrobium sp. ORNL1]
MDSRLEGPLPRIAYSFKQGTFDLKSLAPHLWFEADDGWSTAVRLGGHLQSLFRRIEHLGVVLASAQSGPLSTADTWERPSFQWVSHTGEFVEPSSGAEVRLASLKSVMAVVQEVEDQQVASLQFFDASGEGGLKLMLTNWSDLDYFEALISIHGRAREEGSSRQRLLGGKGNDNDKANAMVVPTRNAVPFEERDEEGAVLSGFTADMVHPLWSGLSRTLPDSHFPGVPGLLRRDALALAGGQHAWQVSKDMVLRAMEDMVMRGVALGGAVRNGVSYVPMAFRPKHWNQCGCGQTFFGECTQFTLRRCCGSAWECWAVCHTNAKGTDEVVCLEFYDSQRRFCGGLGLSTGATSGDHACWRGWLEK